MQEKEYNVSIKDVLFGQAPNWKNLPNPFTGQLANLGYAFGPAKKYWKGILGSEDASNIPGVGMFDSQEASAYEQAQRRPRLQSGYSNDRLAQLEFQRSQRDIGMQRMGYVGDVRNQAAQGLAGMFQNYNQFTSNNLANAAGLYNDAYRDMSRKPGGLIQSLASGAGAAAGAFA